MPPDGCRGYELRRDLNFQLFSSYRDTKNKDLWTRGLGWKPIGSFSDAFSAWFEGNGYTIFNLSIDNAVDNIGLFRKIANSGKSVRLYYRELMLRVDLRLVVWQALTKVLS